MGRVNTHFKDMGPGLGNYISTKKKGYVYSSTRPAQAYIYI